MVKTSSARWVNRPPLERTPPDGDTYNHLLVLAENEDGYRNLVKITSEASLHGFYYKPRVSKKFLAEHAKGLIATGEVFDHVSIIDSHFTGRVEEVATVAGKPAVVNSISGRAWLTGIAQYGVDPDDPYPRGYTLPDTWFA